MHVNHFTKTLFCCRLIQGNKGHEVVECIRKISLQGRACKQDPALYALAVCARSNDETTKHNAYRVLNDVCRIPTHLFQFIKYSEEMNGHETGWGRAQRQAVSKWYKQFVEVGSNGHKTPLKLAYLVTKYRRRYKWSHRDVIRLAHVRSKNKAVRITLQYALGKPLEVADCKESLEVTEFLSAVKEAKRCSVKKMKEDEGRLCEYIALYQLSWEHVPNQFLKYSVKVWDVLFRTMPMTAMIRNLGKMTSFGMHTGEPATDFWVQHVVNRLDDDIQLARARIHPLTLLIALNHYELGLQRNQKIKWHLILESLRHCEMRFSEARTCKKYLWIYDNSGEAAAAMVYSTVQTEDVEVILFTNRIEDAFTATIRKEDNLQTIKEKIFQIPIETGSDYIKHDLSVPFIWAASRKEKFDAIMVFTDSITSCGFIHPAEALKQYTQYMTIPDYRFVVVAMTSDKYSVAAPDSVHNLDVVGFDTMTPGIIMDFVENSQQTFKDHDIILHSDEDRHY
ncbi:SSA2 [Mytilus edulis]|uniref:TROVE2 n=1 Tax=Mytilus edulis TaxID=6550 RepID=A0A8S3SX78_MYTED|nr:SSA2 [Mytilus edulis]